MPTYHFRCPQGHDFNRFYKTMSAAPTDLECPECGATASRQLSGGAGLLFKGSGFYLTDYGKNAHRGGAPEKKSEAASGGTTGGKTKAGDAKGEGAAKPESKAETPKPKAESATPKPKSE
jgi:putative FmdB family regulatory protein